MQDQTIAVYPVCVAERLGAADANAADRTHLAWIGVILIGILVLLRLDLRLIERRAERDRGNHGKAIERDLRQGDERTEREDTAERPGEKQEAERYRVGMRRTRKGEQRDAGKQNATDHPHIDQIPAMYRVRG